MQIFPLTRLQLSIDVIDLIWRLHAAPPIVLFTYGEGQQLAIFILCVTDRAHGELAQLTVLYTTGNFRKIKNKQKKKQKTLQGDETIKKLKTGISQWNTIKQEIQKLKQFQLMRCLNYTRYVCMSIRLEFLMCIFYNKTQHYIHFIMLQ